MRPKPKSELGRKLQEIVQRETKTMSVVVVSPIDDCQEKKENEMDTTIRDAKIHLKNRTREELSKKVDKLSRQFGLENDKFPDTFEELLDRIVKGKYVISDEHKKIPTWGNPLGYVEFRDPAIVRDRKGFDAASEIESAKAQAILDKIVALDTEKGLAAFEAYRDASS